MRKLFLVSILSILLAACAAAPVRQDIHLQGDHGRLSAVLQTPKCQKSYPLVIIMHGFNASKDMYLLTNLAKQLNQRGVATLLFDFNGHGQSEGSFLEMTIPNELEDARRVYAYTARLPQVKSVSMVGHSMGAVVAAMLAGELGAEKIKTVVLMSPAPELTEDTAKGDLFGVQYDPANVPPYITLSNGLQVGRAFLSTTPHVPVYPLSVRYTGPVLVVHSQDDQLVPYHYAVEFSQIYQHAQLETLHGLDHNFTQDTPGVNKMVAGYVAKQTVK